MTTNASSDAIGPRPPQTRSFDLRERKRTRTRLMIQAEALRLFAEKGYPETTVEEIADAAAISPRTFFRYFPTKEDVVIWDEYDPLVPDLLEARPDDEPPAETLRVVIREALGGLYRRDPERLLARVRLSASVPDLRARFAEEQQKGMATLAPLLTQKRWTRSDDLQLRVIGAALIAAVSVALDRWQQDNGNSDLLALLDQTIDALANGIRELQPLPQPRDPDRLRKRRSR
jgi:AcrR family transcriptional regulator